MITFVVFAAVLTAAGVIAVVIPLLRSRGALAPAPWAALGAAGVLVLGSVLLYLTWSNWSWRAAPAADSPQTMVARLARQLEADPQNLEGWLMLGRSYVVLQEFPLALRAFERADRLSGGKNVEALIGQAEALALQDPAELEGRAGRLDRACARARSGLGQGAVLRCDRRCPARGSAACSAALCEGPGHESARQRARAAGRGNSRH